MKRLLFILSLALTCVITGMAQESDSKRINKIKRDNKYLYAEDTKPTEQEARQGAEETLQTYIDEYVATEKKLKKAEHIVIKDLQSKIDRIEMKRGTMVRAFVYVKKSDIIPAENVVVTDGPGDPDRQAEPVSTIEPLPAPSLEATGLPQWQQELIKELLQKQTLTEARAHLNRLKAEYKVKRLGAPAAAKNTAQLFWVVALPNGGGLTVLGPGNEERINYRTMTTDQLSAYSGNDALWFEMAK